MESEILQRSAKIVFRNSSMRDSTLTFAMSFSHKYNMRYIRDLILFGKEFLVLWCKVESRCLLERAGYKIVTSKKIKSSLTLIDTTRIQAWFNEGNFNCTISNLGNWKLVNHRLPPQKTPTGNTADYTWCAPKEWKSNWRRNGGSCLGFLPAYLVSLWSLQTLNSLGDLLLVTSMIVIFPF